MKGRRDMLTELCRECRNWFTTDSDKHSGDFTISDGGITPFDFVLSGQYFRIMGSHFNDGVYKNVPEEVAKLAAETFTGQIWAMRIPPAFIDLSGKIEEYIAKNEKEISPYTSESFGGYSYTKAVNDKNVPLTWQEVFNSKLKVWRKI